MIKIEKLFYSYADGTEALHDISMEIPRENIFAVLGESGSGKTTLLNCIARFLSPQKGRITLNGTPVQDISEKEFRKSIGVVFQRLNLFPHMTITENMVLAPCNVQRRPREEAVADAHDMLQRLGIGELADAYPAQVSGGQAQRAAIARGLMLKPQFMLLDEPTSALDAITTRDFAQWLRELREDTSFIIVTHDLVFAQQTAQHGVYMKNGKIENSGATAEIVASSTAKIGTGE